MSSHSQRVRKEWWSQGGVVGVVLEGCEGFLIEVRDGVLGGRQVDGRHP